MPVIVREMRGWMLVGWLIVLAGPLVAAEPSPAQQAKPVAEAKAAGSVSEITLTEERLVETAKATGMSSAALRLTLDYIRKYKPLTAWELVSSPKAAPRQLRVRLVEIFYQARQLAEIKDADRRAQRELYLTIEAQAEQAAVRYRKAAEIDRPQIEKQLKDILDKLFDMRIADERAQLEQARKDLAEKETAAEQRAKNKERIVDRELTRMLGITESLAW